jgi:hypothetical protein
VSRDDAPKNNEAELIAARQNAVQSVFIDGIWPIANLSKGVFVRLRFWCGAGLN